MFLLVAAVLAVVAAFVAENGSWALVKVPVVGSSLGKPLSWIAYEAHQGGLLVGCFVAGVVSVVLLLLIPLSLRRGYERRRRERFIGALEGELSDLRNLPLTQPAPYEDIDEAPPSNPSGPSGSAAKGRKRRRLIEDDDEALLIAALQEPDRSATSGDIGGER
ncbi:MAG: hypothetical protein CSB49_05640 [Proteobacteria bacterium]|nr:MAG: hypothetical protein CSB49_05640 [Pseudomonadota bacterium]